MCGIIGYVGHRPAQELLLAGLEKLEYRGYDSAGLAIAEPGGNVASTHAVGPLAALRERLGSSVSAGRAGIGHTRWATHGGVTEANAHPHADESERAHVVLNGIVENHAALRAELEGRGVAFTSETDAEVVAHLLGEHLREDGLEDAVRRTADRLEGHFAFAALSAGEPGVLVGARRHCPLMVGRADGEQFLASGVPAFLAETNRVQVVQDGEIVRLDSGGTHLSDAGGRPVTRTIDELDSDVETAEKDGYDTFMAKEIEEQPAAVAETVFDRLTANDRVTLCELQDDPAVRAALRDARRLTIVACGTSYHAGLFGRYAIEAWSDVPVGVEVASEDLDRDATYGPGDVVVAITQSGETADTLAAMRAAREGGATVLAITNAEGSQAGREADAVLLTRAGLEVGVAATKTFMAQAVAVMLLGLWLAQERAAAAQPGLRALPELLDATIAGNAPAVEAIADTAIHRNRSAIDAIADTAIHRNRSAIDAIADAHAAAPLFLFLGRHAGVPIAYEGALKLEEVTYVPSLTYAAGEMKHGPIALIGEGTPVVVVATGSPAREKVLANMEEVRARGASVIAVVDEGDEEAAAGADHVLRVPPATPLLQALLAVVPLQQLALAIAGRRGLDVDKPRNLAKTVTVQ